MEVESRSPDYAGGRTNLGYVQDPDSQSESDESHSNSPTENNNVHEARKWERSTSPSHPPPILTSSIKIPHTKISTISESVESNGLVPNGTGTRNGIIKPQSLSCPNSRRNSEFLNINNSTIPMSLPQQQPFIPPLPSNKSCIVVESGRKAYGKLQVLRNVHMNVKEGSVYGLLGSSGCGKTTLLSCIVGIRSLDRGRVFVCGDEPGSPGSGVPGTRVGYMPQEVALNMEFTVNEVCTYFGRIYGMDSERVQDRIEYLINLLDLRKCTSQLKNLSGGQQRRASFAVALLHEPEILILDEPTVGVDPLLRASIWAHLRELVADYGTTVVITTHYIEEMRQADRVGIMREGFIIAQDSPNNLMALHNAKMLEEVVLKFCIKGTSTNKAQKKKKNNLSNVRFSYTPPSPIQQAHDQTHPSPLDIPETITFAQLSRVRHSICFYNEPANGPPSMESTTEELSYPTQTPTPTPVHQTHPWYSNSPAPEDIENYGFDEDSESVQDLQKNKYQTSKLNILRALILKNVLVIMRNVWFLVFILLMPGIVIAVFCLAIGPQPEDLPFGVINFENPDNTCANYQLTECKPSNLSCAFVQGLDTSLVEIKFINSETEALKLVDQQKLWGYVVFRDGFSKGIFEKTFGKSKEGPAGANDPMSQVEIRLDMSSYAVSQLLRKNVFDAYLSFTKALAKSCQAPMGQEGSQDDSIPLDFKEPIYGTYDGEYTDFIAPGISIGFIFFLAVITCGLAAITEKKDGMFNRCLVAGVTTLEIMVSHLITQFGIIVVQTCIVFVTMFTMFEVPSAGAWSIALGFALVILLNVAGMSLGLLFSTMFEEEKNAMLVGFAAVLPNYLLAGLIWPFEGLPPAMRAIGYCLPTTFAGESLRSILLRGWGLDHFTVWIGFVSGGAWIAGPWILLYLITRSASKK